MIRYRRRSRCSDSGRGSMASRWSLPSESVRNAREGEGRLAWWSWGAEEPRSWASAMDTSSGEGGMEGWIAGSTPPKDPKDGGIAVLLWSVRERNASLAIRIPPQSIDGSLRHQRTPETAWGTRGDSMWALRTADSQRPDAVHRRHTNHLRLRHVRLDVRGGARHDTTGGARAFLPVRRGVYRRALG